MRWLLVPADIKESRALSLLVGTNQSPLVSKCMMALSTRRQYVTPGERAIAVITRSVECSIRVEAFDVGIENSSIELVRCFTLRWSGRK